MGDKVKYPLVGWDIVCTPIANCGLGIKKLVTFNQALLSKWQWHFKIEEIWSWRSEVAVKYGVERLVHEECSRNS